MAAAGVQGRARRSILSRESSREWWCWADEVAACCCFRRVECAPALQQLQSRGKSEHARLAPVWPVNCAAVCIHGHSLDCLSVFAARIPCDGAGLGAGCTHRGPACGRAGARPALAVGSWSVSQAPMQGGNEVSGHGPCSLSLVKVLVTPPERAQADASCTHAARPLPGHHVLCSISVAGSALCIPFLHCRTPQRACNTTPSLNDPSYTRSLTCNSNILFLHFPASRATP